jgi:MFS family permease
MAERDDPGEPDPVTAEAAATSGSLLRHPAFVLLWCSRTAWNLAVSAEGITLAWQVYTIARRSETVAQSTFLVGMLGLAQFAPLCLLSLYAGVTADCRDRRSIVLACLGVEALCAAALALLPDPDLAVLFTIAGLIGAARAFLSPASSAMTPMLVPRQSLPRAISWNSLGDQSSSVVGPLIGGALCAISPSAAYGAAALLYAAALGALLTLRADTRPEPQAGSRLALIREGMVYVWRTRVVLGAISLDLFAVLLGGAAALLPVYARDILHLGAGGFGLLRAGPAIGAVLMTLALVRWPLRRRAGRWLFAGVAAYGLSTLVFAVSTSVAVSLIALVLIGAADMVSVSVRQSLVQIITPVSMLGRVSAVAGLFIGGSAELGEFETGAVARLLGPVGAAIAGGIGSLLITGTWLMLFPSLRAVDRLERPGR